MPEGGLSVKQQIELVRALDSTRFATLEKKHPEIALRVDRLAEFLGSRSDARRALQRTPSLLGYTVETLRRKVDELSVLFGPGADVTAMLKREPALLTYKPESVRAKVSALEAALPNVDAKKLLQKAPRLLGYSESALPLKLAALEAALPGADVQRLVRNVPQLLELDADRSLRPKLAALRRIFHPSRALDSAPRAANPAQRLAAAKLLRVRARSGAKAAASSSILRRNASAANRPLSTIGLLRLASLDIAVLEQRLGRLSEMLPEVDVIGLVGRQPALLRRDVDGALRPRLAFLSGVLGAAEAHRLVVANPRLLMSSWGVLGRLRFVAEAAVPRGFKETPPSSAIMAPKAAFLARFPRYDAWLQTELGVSVSARNASTSDVGDLESRHGDLLERRVSERGAKAPD